jgi:O-antigen/teichoic acid export membrane protein
MKPFLSNISFSPNFKSTLHSISTGLIQQFLLLISGTLVARLLGVEGRGLLATIVVWAVLFSRVGTLGVPDACTFLISRQPEKTPLILGETYRIAIFQMVLLTIAFFLFFFLWSRGSSQDFQIAIYPALIFIPTSIIHQNSLAILQGLQHFRAFNLFRLLPLFLYVNIVVLLFLIKKDDLFSVVSAWVISFFLIAVISIFYVLKKTSIKCGRDKHLRNQILKFGLEGHIGSLAPLETLRIDQLAISVFLAPVSLGVYVVGQAFSNLSLFISVSASMVGYPVISKQKRAIVRNHLMWKYFWGVTSLNGIISILLIVAMPTIIPLFFGQEFVSSVPIAQILIIGSLLSGARRVITEGMRGMGQPYVSTIAEISMYPWLLTGGIFLLIRQGILGIAISILIAQGLSLVVAIIIALSPKKAKRDDSIFT